MFFYKNHPIRYVSVAGLIVMRTEITGRTILTLDDSSDATVNVVVLRSDAKESSHDDEAEEIQSAPSATITSNPETETMDPTQPHPHISTTDRSPLDISGLVPGVTVRVKGTLSTFRSTIQLNLERFSALSTNAEMAFLDERYRFLVEVLWEPWVLLDEEVEQLRREAEEAELKALEQRRRAEKLLRRRVEREQSDQRHIWKRYERDERKRENEAVVCREEGVRVMEEIRRRKELDRLD